ncbi:outer membrane protein assembly factor BamE domain-containing protein [Luteimonas sp. e5]
MNPILIVLGAAALLATASTPAAAQERYDGFLCCNMRTDGSWISDINYAEGGKKMLPAGTPVSITGHGRNRVRVVIDGSKQAIGNDYSRDLKPDEFASRYVLREDPRQKIASWPAKVQQAVRQSKLTAGMTREQVRTALGWPVSSENPDLESNLWRYWLDSFKEFQVHFDARGRVTRLTADPAVMNRVWLP